jgi:hypothetical protein
MSWRALCAAAAMMAGAAGAAGPATAAGGACAAAPYRQLDFWLGDWDVFDVAGGAAAVAHAHITRLLDNCVLHELYESADPGGLRGESFSLFDHSRGVWHQSWVTNHGVLLLLDGGLEGDRMALTATEKASDGTTSLLRGVWWRKVTPCASARRPRPTVDAPGSRPSI